MNNCFDCNNWVTDSVSYDDNPLCIDCIGLRFFDSQKQINGLCIDLETCRNELRSALEQHEMMAKQFELQEIELQKYRQKEEEEKLKN